jgi:integrase/recombinase XerD
MQPIDQAITYFTTECGLAANTVAAYHADLVIFERFLLSRNASLNTFSHDDVAAFVKFQTGSIATIRRRVATIRTLIKFQMLSGRDGATCVRLLACIDRPKADRKLPSFLSRAQVVTFINATTNARDLAIVELLYATGIRASELVGLSVENIGFNTQSIRVLGKGSKERIVPVGQPALVALRAYLGDRKTGIAFLSRTGEPLNRRDLWKIIRKVWLNSGLAQKVSPHTLRHCFASHLLSGHDAIEISGDGMVSVHQKNGGANIREVQELLGHESVNTTQAYTHLDLGRLKKVHQLLGR